MVKKQMELFQKGGLEDDGGTKDPVSGNDVPIGSSKKEVRDDIPAQLSEGEFVFPADVVRYLGLDFLMQLRQKAKMGLKKMEAMGQMGNSDEATLPDDIPFDEGDLSIVIAAGEKPKDDKDKKEMNEGGVVNMQEGGSTRPRFFNAPVDTDTQQQEQQATFSGLLGKTPYKYDELRKYVSPDGMIRYIPFKDGEPLYPIDDLISQGYEYEDPTKVPTDPRDVVVETAKVTDPNLTRDPQREREEAEAQEQATNRSYDNMIKLAMEQNPNMSKDELIGVIKDGKVETEIFGFKFNMPGITFNEDKLSDAWSRVTTETSRNIEKPDVVPLQDATLLTPDTKTMQSGLRTPEERKQFSTAKARQELAREAELARMQIEGRATDRVDSKFKTDAQKEEDKARREEQIKKEKTAISKQQDLARQELYKTKTAQKEQKKIDDYTASKIESARRTGRPIGGFKKGGIATKPVKKKVMKRGGLASKK